jgi:hypothetical protein
VDGEPESEQILDESEIERIGAETSTPVERALAEERMARQAAREAEQRARWEAGLKREGVWELMQLVEQRLAELPALAVDRAQRAALVPRAVRLAQDALDAGLPSEWERKVHALHRALTTDPLIVGNAPAARRLLAQICDFDPDDFETHVDVNGYVRVKNPNLFAVWHRELQWYCAPVPAPSAAACRQALELLERDVLAVIRGERRR